MGDLLPCPFCGEMPRMRPFAEPFTGVAINCETVNCPASPISTGNALADPLVNFNAWNRRAPPAEPAEDVRAGALKEAADVDWSTGRDVADTAPGYLTDWQRGFVAGQTAMRNAILALIPEAKP